MLLGVRAIVTFLLGVHVQRKWLIYGNVFSVQKPGGGLFYSRCRRGQGVPEAGLLGGIVRRRLLGRGQGLIVLRPNFIG